MNWYVVDKDYIQYLLKFDSKVGYINYGSRLKLYLGTILEIGNFFYYVPISSAKTKHKNMKNSLDFQKIQDKNHLYAVLNLNNMIPVPNDCLRQLKYDQIENFRKFDSNKDRVDYIYLLQKEKQIIDAAEEIIKNKAQKLYTKCTEAPNSKLAARCCNFRLLEEKLLEYVFINV
jgi:protein AbiQ